MYFNDVEIVFNELDINYDGGEAERSICFSTFSHKGHDIGAKKN